MISLDQYTIFHIVIHARSRSPTCPIRRRTCHFWGVQYRWPSTALEELHAELEDTNQSAARSLAEGLEETVTLHRLGVYGMLGRSFKTTNCLESVNALVEERCAKVDHWKNSSQRERWLATALVDIEPRLRRVRGYRHLPKLRNALRRELNRHEDVAGESRLINQEPWTFQLGMGLTPWRKRRVRSSVLPASRP